MKPALGSILVVDDEQPTLLYISRYLQHHGYQVTTAETGQAALRAIHAQAFDLILLDIVMPGISGFQVLERLKADPLLYHIPVIMISVMDDIEGIVRCIELGAEDYLLKPINAVFLDARVSTCLERKHLRDQEQSYLRQLQIEKHSAETANRAKSVFLANMSHELRTPLNAIIGYSDMLHEDFDADGQQGYLPDIDKIRMAGNRLLLLINDLLDISKLEAGQVSLYLEPFDVQSLVAEVSTGMTQAIASRHNQFQVQYGEEVSRMVADLSKVRQILWNLLDNAVKSTQNGTISLTVSRTSRRLPASAAPADWINIAVQDTGVGIPIEQQGRLFEVFTQADDFSTRNDSGSSLGLAISHRLAHMMGGYIDVVSAPGQGTTLTLRLPATVIARAADPTVAVPTIALNPRSPVSPVSPGLPGPGLPGPGLPVLAAAGLPLSSPEAELVVVVDDSPTTRDRLVQALNQTGARAVATWCGSEGLRLSRELRPSLITLDLSLPDQEAWSVLAAIKTDPALADIPVVMLSLLSQPAAIADSSNASDGATGNGATGNGAMASGAMASGAMGVTLGIVDYLTTPKDVRRLVNLAQRYLPAVSATGAAGAAAAGAATEAVIWLVQDDSDMQPMLERVLTRQHWHLVPWADLEPALHQALQPLSTSPTSSFTPALPNLVVLDLALLGGAHSPLMAMLGRLIVTRSLPVISIITHELTPETTLALCQQVARYLDQPDQQRANVFTDLDCLMRSAISRSSCPSSP